MTGSSLYHDDPCRNGFNPWTRLYAYEFIDQLANLVRWLPHWPWLVSRLAESALWTR